MRFLLIGWAMALIGGSSAACQHWCKRKPSGEYYCCNNGTTTPTTTPTTTTTPVPTGKPGNCPPLEQYCGFAPSGDPDLCSSDYGDNGCPTDEKCCYDRCKEHHICKTPYSTNTTPSTIVAPPTSTPTPTDTPSTLPPALCSSHCNNGGSCTGPNRCTCTDGYIGHTCEILAVSQTFTTRCVAKGGFLTPSNDQCFIWYGAVSRTMEEAQTKCTVKVLQLARPKDNNAEWTRQYIVEQKDGVTFTWIGGRGNGIKNIIWDNDQQILRNNNTLWLSNPKEPSSYSLKYGLLLATKYEWMTSYPNETYLVKDMSNEYSTLCEMPE